MSNENTKKMGFGGLFAVASVWFGSHAGGGFATGNQATQYYVQYGWLAPIMAVLSMAILAFVARECIVMCNNHGFTNYKPLWEEMWAPYSKLEILFEVYFMIIVICAVSAAIAGSASLLVDYGVPYALGVFIIGCAVLLMTIFGASLVAKASAAMSVIILVCIAIIFVLGIMARPTEVATIFAERQTDGSILTMLWKVITYAGFQSVMLPALVSCASTLKTAKNASRAMFIGFLLNAIALGLSCVMLLAWYKTGPTTYFPDNLTLPTIFICRQLGMPFLEYVYALALFMCFVSTCVTSVYGLVPRFETNKIFANMKDMTRRVVISLIAIVISMGFSMVGLTNIIKYGYGYCGILGVFIIIIPMLTIGRSKNRKFLKEHPEMVGE